ncbi:FMRFamide receptor-like [Lingula anatina]|uniref:FMRFamide receptor-like n=1 Tax=Lingula anatina TaxID=7574 RepID=A0A1S3J9I6_LINAN|nr:FMRFamide receptor-like [Lingula anatina]XP_013407062.1 FMRFamide receptor-like [Lingula anatina]XP_013407063.1 FMRFamide receptor-like [Lingula anatina]XP_013407064.1 FMRFamide receptor-like [Lingula anatina]|eukprot:XP_013407061.1 FMRFamide receptor-like [Lingula anatina]
MNSSLENVTECSTRVSDSWIWALFFSTQSVICITFIVFGLFGNTLSFVVLRRENPKTTTALTLQALAVTDSVYLLCHFFFLSLMGIVKYVGTARHYVDVYGYLMLFVKPLMYISQQCSIWFVVLVTVDRFVVVCRPLKSGAFCTMTRARKHVIIVAILSLIYNMPRWFELDLGFCYDVDLGHMRPINSDKEWMDADAYKYFYAMVLNSLVNFIAPMAILVFVNTSLILALRKAGKRRHELTGQGHPSKSTTVMLVVVVLVFVACQTCDFVLQFLYFLDNESVRSSDALFVYYMISSMMVVVNASTNFLIYCICGKKFRNLLLSLMAELCGRSLHRKKRSSKKPFAGQMTNSSQNVCKTPSLPSTGSQPNSSGSQLTHESVV